MTYWEWTHAAIGGFAALIFLIQTLGSSDHDFDADAPDMTEGGLFHDHTSGLSDYLSLRNFVAFFIGYGWVTLASLLFGLSLPLSAFLGVIAGIAFVFASLLLIKSFLKLQEDGNLKLEGLKGAHASVYIAIGESGSALGKVMIDTPKGRMELPARTHDKQKLNPGTLVEVTGTESGILWVSRV